MNLTLVLRQYLDRTSRQATFWKAKHYSAIPHYVKPHFIDTSMTVISCAPTRRCLRS